MWAEQEGGVCLYRIAQSAPLEPLLSVSPGMNISDAFYYMLHVSDNFIPPTKIDDDAILTSYFWVHYVYHLLYVIVAVETQIYPFFWILPKNMLSLRLAAHIVPGVLK